MLPLLPLPGIWYGSPYIELSDTSYIASSTGYLSVIEYKGKGYFSGKSHSFKAQVFPPLPGFNLNGNGNGSNTPSTTAKYTIEGTWNGTSKTKDGRIFSDVTGPKTEVQTGDEETMGEYETRKLWKEVAKGIRSGDFEMASREKSKIEVRIVMFVFCLFVDFFFFSFVGYVEFRETEEERRSGCWDDMEVATLCAH